jgi:hypothetical protein
MDDGLANKTMDSVLGYRAGIAQHTAEEQSDNETDAGPSDSENHQPRRSAHP